MLGEVFALAAIGGYVLAVGWQPSVVRAGIAGALASLAWLAARPQDRWYFLLLGAAVLLAWNPYSLLDAGFQLSFAAVAAIFVVVPRLERSLAGYPVPRSLAEVVAVSAACGVATAPILLTQFGAVPLYSIPANALAFPVVAPLLGLALVTALVAPAVPPVAVALAWLNGWLAAYLAGCARLVGGLPYAAVSTRTALVAAAVVLGLVVGQLALAPATRTAGCRADPARGADRRRLASSFRHSRAACSERAANHVPRRRPGRRRAPAGPGRGGARSTRAHRRRTSRDSCGGSAWRACRSSSSRIPSAITSAGRRRCSNGCGSGSSSIRRSRAQSTEEQLGARRSSATPRAASSSPGPGRAIASARLRLRVLWPDGPGLTGRGSERPRDRPPRVLRRGRRTPDRRRRVGRDRPAARSARSRS